MAKRRRSYKRATRLDRNLGLGYRKGQLTFVGCTTVFVLPLIIGAAVIALWRS